MRRILGHKWAVGVGALVLVFALGAIAWAATEDAAGPAPDEAVTPAPFGLGMLDSGDGPMGESVHFGRGPRGGGMGGEITDEMRAQMEERRAAREAQRDAFLDLVREKMSAEDQAALDELLGTAETQREALEQARESLHDTTSKIRELVGKYFPTADDGADSSATTAPEADGTSM